MRDAIKTNTFERLMSLVGNVVMGGGDVKSDRVACCRSLVPGRGSLAGCGSLPPLMMFVLDDANRDEMVLRWFMLCLLTILLKQPIILPLFPVTG